MRGAASDDKTFNPNLHLVQAIPDKYRKYKAGIVTKGHYDYYRRMQLKRYARNIGPVIEKVVYGKRIPNEVIRIDRGRPPASATQSIHSHVGRLKALARAASRGSIVLTGAGLGLGCLQIAGADTRLEKNVVAVETITSTLIGGLGGAIATVLLLSNPAGWFVVLAIGATITVGSAGTGYLFGQLYKSYDGLNSFDLVGRSSIDSLCR